MIVLHVVVPGGAPPVAGLETVGGRQVGVLVTERSAAPEPTVAEVLAHGRAVHEAARRGPVLPFRFGAVLAGRPEVRRTLRRAETTWAARLAAVAGHVELIVHVDRWPAAARAVEGTARVAAAGGAAGTTAEAAGMSGADYLRLLAGRDRAARAWWDDLLAGVPRAEQRLLAGTVPRASLLVPVTGVARARAALDAAAGRLGCRVDVTGPWPPYSFCEQGVGDA